MSDIAVAYGLEKDRPVARNWIDGRWDDAGERRPSANPATGALIGEYVDGGLAAARRAFDTTDWPRKRFDRIAALSELADVMTRRKGDLIRALAEENGMLIPEATLEVEWTLTKVRYNAALAATLVDAGRAAEVNMGLYSISMKEPVGVAGIIVPWNAPVILMIRSLAPALAAGCTAVVKAAPETALVSGLLMQCLAEVKSLPAGVVNMFVESGADGVRWLVQSPEVDTISYTGSTKTGKLIMAEGAETLKRLSLELGGKCPAIIFADADLDHAIPNVVAMGNLFAGQFCMQASRILVEESRADEVRERLVQAFGSTHVGPASDTTSQMGPLINGAARDRVAALVERATGEGEVLVKGRPLEGPGAFLTPSLVEVSDTGSPYVQDELFGPIVTLETFADDDEAAAKANAVRYGLAASIWTSDSRRPIGFGRKLKSGTVWANAHGLILDQFEEGGFRDSGVGRLNGPGGVESFLETKHYLHPAGL